MIQQQHQSFQKLSGSAEESESARNSRHSGQLTRPVAHTSTLPHSEIVRDPAYRSSFAVKERLSNWCFNCFKCGNSEASFVSTLDEIQRRNPVSISQEKKKLFADKIVKLKILQTSRLQLDANVMHPFVKVHIVNKNTGCYLQNLQKTEDPAIYHKQELTSYNKIERKYESTENDILLPFATACCDFRKLGNSKGVWNQKIYINYPAAQLMNPDTLFLFEILDFNHQALLYRNDQGQYDRKNMFRVAWSFLRPVGIAKTHMGKIQLELYSYKFNQQPNEPSLNKSFIPDVYYDFLWNNHQKYEGFLQVQLNYCQRPKYKFIGEEGQVPSSLFEEEQADRKYLDRYLSEDLQANIEERQKATKDLYKFFRNRDICEIPKQLIYKVESQHLGCFRVKFVGNYLLAACSKKKNTIVKVVDLNNGEHIMSLRGHRGVLYDIQITSNETIIVTAGSDHIVRVANFPSYTGQFIDEDESEEFIIADCVHSGAVYSVSLVHKPLQGILYILTCCYDGYLRLWECRLGDKVAKIAHQILINDLSRSPKKVYPTACAVMEGSSFIVGDSLGQIRVYDFGKDKLTERCLITHEQLKNDLVLNIHILNKNHLIIQSSDNLIRHFDLIGSKLRLSQSYSGGVFEKELIQCSVSPDNKYLLSPSEAGKPLLWDIFTGTHIPLEHLNLNVKGHLVCSDWHPRYNLVAISGFFDYCPVFVFGNVLGEAEIKLVSAQIS